ncbi:nuclease domain-containing protein [Pectobacterium carotovorum]|uniref:nuclease domain-containing protein n=1 Tax=Pectobacterium odoriferum TaxID=78398 RepID=UPI001FCC6EE1|nr:nuclease domain-containing protein [Pectobacterium odoriferum]
MIRKFPAFRKKALREPARGQVYALQIPDIRNGNSETVALCHLPSITHGMGYKRDDFWAIYICLSCHDVIGGHVPYDWRVGGERGNFVSGAVFNDKKVIIS